MRKILVSLIAAYLLWAGSPASAAAIDVSNPDRITKGFDIQELAAIAEAAGWTAEILTNDQGKKVLFVKLQQGGFFAFPKACDTGRCTALELQALYSAKQVPFSTLNAFNVSQSFAMAFSFDGELRLSRDEYAAYGIPIGNISASMKSFVYIASRFTDFLIQSGASASLSPPEAGPVRTFAPGTVGSSASSEHAKLKPPSDKYVFQVGL